MCYKVANDYIIIYDHICLILNEKWLLSLIWFQAVDQDRSGKITAKELQQALLNNNWSQFNPETCRLMIGMFDKDQ